MCTVYGGYHCCFSKLITDALEAHETPTPTQREPGDQFTPEQAAPDPDITSSPEVREMSTQVDRKLLTDRDIGTQVDAYRHLIKTRSCGTQTNPRMLMGTSIGVGCNAILSDESTQVDIVLADAAVQVGLSAHDSSSAPREGFTPVVVWLPNESSLPVILERDTDETMSSGALESSTVCEETLEINEDDNDDPDYSPSEADTDMSQCTVDYYDGESKTDWTPDGKSFIVTWESLQMLLSRCSTCGSCAIVNQIYNSGSMIGAKLVCEKHHEVTWRSQRIIRGYAEENLRISAAILFT